MANYDFRCQSCSTEVEKNVPMDRRDEPQVCVCGGELKRMITFKGSVWAPTSTGSTFK